MRELRFRAWHKTAKEMIPNCNQGWEGDVFNWLNEGQPIAIMQYTGLKDKNGKEIYEGDIVSDHLGRGVVEFAEKYAGFRVNYLGNTRAKWFYDYTSREQGSIEVIGNIYENPELVVM